LIVIINRFILFRKFLQKEQTHSKATGCNQVRLCIQICPPNKPNSQFHGPWRLEHRGVYAKYHQCFHSYGV